MKSIAGILVVVAVALAAPARGSDVSSDRALRRAPAAAPTAARVDAKPSRPEPTKAPRVAACDCARKTERIESTRTDVVGH